MTATGLRHIAKAMRIMFRQRKLLAYFERIYKTDPSYAHRHVVDNLLEVWQHVQFCAADAFGDRSEIVYDFGPILAEGPWDFDFRKRRKFHPLYVPPPPPKLPPVPRSGADRLPVRPVEFTEYESSLRRVVWNQEKRRRRRRLDDSVL